jgi:O-antigen/teichoic acid export membrane protein
VFVGSLANVTSAQVGTLVVGYLSDNVNLGYYSLALTLTMPLGMLPGVIGTTMFKEFSRQASISRNAHTITIVATLAIEVGFVVSIRWLASLIYPPQFTPAVNMSYALSLGAVFHGLGDYYNRFLGAHGLGKALRNGAILEGGINLLGYGLFVYILGVEGAILTRIVSGAAYLSAMFISYTQLKRNSVERQMLA